MSLYCVINQDNIVENIIVWDGVIALEFPYGYSTQPANDLVAIGWLYDPATNTYSEPQN
jgi:hypothetical protein